MCFLPRFLGHFFLLQMKRNPKSIQKNEAMKFLILLEFSWLIKKSALKADIINMKLQNQLALDHNF